MDEKKLRYLRALIVAELVGRGWRPPRPDERLLDRFVDDADHVDRQSPRRASYLGLSPAELAVLELKANGFVEREIAEKRGCSPGTVHTHLRNIHRRLGARTGAHAVAIALTAGEIRLIIQPPEKTR